MNCHFCGKEAPKYHNYCDGNCHIEHAKVNGGQEYRPNDLPIACIKADGTMLEHEHGDHPDYKFPVNIYCDREISEEEQFNVFGKLFTEELLRKYNTESHALIYTDGTVALTMYECNYSIWSLSDGKYLGGRYNCNKDRITEESLNKIREGNK